MHEKPVCSALLPDTGVTDLCFHSLTVPCFFGEMHGDGGPGQCAAPGNLQISSRQQASAGHVREQFSSYSVVILLPAVIRERSQIVEDEAVILGVDPARRFGAA